MKKIATILLVLILFIWCMENREKIAAKYDNTSKSVKRFLWGAKSVNTNKTEDTTEAPVTLVEPEKTDTTPSLTLPAVAVLPVAQELAPDLYYTKERLTMMSDDGIKAIAGGVMVQKIGEEGEKFLIKDEKVQIIVEPWKLTRNPVEIAELKKRAASLQDSLRPLAAPPISKTANSKANTSNAKQNTPALISSERAQIEAQISGIDRQIADLREDVTSKQQAESDARRLGRSSSHGAEASRLRLQITALEKQRTYYVNLLKASR